MTSVPFHWRMRMWIYNKLFAYEYFDNWLKSQSFNEEFFFVQIGANDGVTNDPIHSYVKEYGWKGVLVEPQFDSFLRLKENYKEQCQLIFENIAIGQEDGEVELYGIEKSNSEDWHDQIATLNPNVGILKDQGRNISSVTVQALTLNSLLEKHGVSRVDLLLMDLEGYEPKVLESYDWKVKPSLIYFETAHLSYAQFYSVQKLLIDRGYRLFLESRDCLAWLK